jgi:hypothetical protein
MTEADVLGSYLGRVPREHALAILGKHRGEEVATWLELADGRAVMGASGVLDPSAGPEALYEVTDDGIVSFGLPTDCEVEQYEKGMRVATASVALIVRWQSVPTR